MRGEKLMPKISILIPVYNAEQYLTQCLDSVVNQTLKDIEIICVLDGGNDSSDNICRSYAAKDCRIIVIDHKINKGLLAARKTGVDNASGEYIMFLDSDDWLEVDACSRLYDLIKNNNVDILQFGSYVDAEPFVPEQRVAGVKQLLEPYIGRLDGEKVFEGAFLDNKFRFTIWNKIYKTELCKRVYNDFNENENINKAEDLCAFFRLAYFAKSYIGIKDKFYHYRFGAGITGKNKIDLPTFEIHCSQSEVLEKCRLFLLEQGVFDKYRTIYERIKKGLINECINNWFTYLNEENSSEGFKVLVKYWDGTDIAIELSQRWFYDSVIMLSDRIYSPDLLPRTARTIKKIAVYYHRYSMGGVQKVISLLMSALITQGFEVLLITDEQPSDTDYVLPESVKRVVIPASNKPSEYPYHALGLKNALINFEADMVIYNATSSQNVFFDILVVKSLGIPIALYVHEYFGVGYRNLFTLPIRKIKFFRFADVLIALSKVQRDYWRAVGSNAVYLPNPLDDKAHSVKLSALNNHDIIWVGRLSREKRYLDALEILSKVKKVITDARIVFVGNFSSKDDEIEFYKKISSLQLKDSVEFYGYVSDVYPIYERCSLYLHTSEAESFCMTLAESKLAGLPCVMYKMPYLELQQGSKGIIAVNMYDTSAAAEAIIRIFSNSELKQRLGKEARESIEPFLSYEYAKEIKQIIRSLETAPVFNQINPSSKIIVDTLIDEYLRAVNKYLTLKKKLDEVSSAVTNEGNTELQKKLTGLKNEIISIKNSYSYKMGRIITWIPRKVRNLVKETKKKDRIHTSGVNSTTEHVRLGQYKIPAQDQPLLSIVIPACNCALISSTIDKLLKQKIKNIEIICIFYSLNKQFENIPGHNLPEDKRVRYFFIQGSQPSFCYNLGIKEIRGKYVLFTEPGVYYKPYLLKNVVAAAEKANSEILVFNNGESLKNLIMKGTVSSKEMKHELFSFTTLPLSSVLFSTNFIRKCGILFPPFQELSQTAFLLTILPKARFITFIKQTPVKKIDNAASNVILNKFELPVTSLLDTSLFIKSKIAEDCHISGIDTFVRDLCIRVIKSGKTANETLIIKDYIRDNLSYRFTFFKQSGECYSIFNYEPNNPLYKPELKGVKANIPVSVIIPVYNPGKYLRTCLDSVLQQTLKNIEVICVDDGSTDGSLDILRAYEKSDPRVRVITQQNSGAGIARNHGMRYANGEYIVFLDADDFFEPDFLECLYEQCLKDSADIGVCAADKFHVEKKTFEPLPALLMTDLIPKTIPFNRKDIPDTIFLFTTTSPWNKMFRREFIERLHLTFQDNKRANDGYFVMSALARAERITVINKRLVHYRVGMSSNLQANNYQNPTIFCRALHSVKMELEIDGIYEDIKRSFANLALNNCIYIWDTLQNYPVEQARLESELCNYYFDEFDIAGHQESYFFNKGYYKKYKKIIDEYKVNKLP